MNTHKFPHTNFAQEKFEKHQCTNAMLHGGLDPASKELRFIITCQYQKGLTQFNIEQLVNAKDFGIHSDTEGLSNDDDIATDAIEFVLTGAEVDINSEILEEHEHDHEDEHFPPVPNAKQAKTKWHKTDKFLDIHPENVVHILQEKRMEKGKNGDVTFPDECLYRSLQLNHSIDKHRCKVCQKGFVNEYALLEHVNNIHSESKPYVHKQCSKDLTSKEKLLKNIESRTFSIPHSIHSRKIDASKYSDTERGSTMSKSISVNLTHAGTKNESEFIDSIHARTMDESGSLGSIHEGRIDEIFEEYPERLKRKKPEPRKLPKKRCTQSTTGYLTSVENNIDQEEDGDEKDEDANENRTASIGVQVHIPVCSFLSKRTSTTLRNLKRKCSRLTKQISKLKSTVEAQKCLLKERLRKTPLEKKFQEIVSEATFKHSLKANFLIEQVNSYGKKKGHYEETTVKICALLQRKSSKAYKYLRQIGILHIPHPATLKRYIGYASGEIGVTSLIKCRLAAEFKGLKTDSEKLGSLIIDEMAIKPKLIYDRKLDVFLGQPNIDMNLIGLEDKLANKLLCFLFRGLTTPYRIPVAFYFTSNITAFDLKNLTLKVITAVEEEGFIVQRVVTDNYSVNTLMFQLLSGDECGPCISHPNDKTRKLFLAFDQCHVIKNVRSQFLTKTFSVNDNEISANHLKCLYDYQKTLPGLIKPVRFLTRKHLFPTSFEKMNVLRAVQIFSIELIAALETMVDISPENVVHKAGLQETINFMKIMRKWFELHDICNQTQYIYSRNQNKCPFYSLDDERLQWLQNDFLHYIEQIQSSLEKEKRFSDETYHALRFTTVSTVLCVRHLLQEGFHYVLSRNFSSDDIEALFSHVRQLGGYNDMMDVRSSIFGIEATLKTGLIKASISANVEAREPPLSTTTALISLPAKEIAYSSCSENNIALPDKVMKILSRFYNPQGVQPTMKNAAVAMIAGYIVKVAEESTTCFDCLQKLSRPKSCSPVLRLIFHQDRGGLKYPSFELVRVLDIISDFVFEALKNVCLKQKGIRKDIVRILIPHFQNLLCCKNCDSSDFVRVILEKYVNPLFDNFGKAMSEKLQPVKTLHNKPLSRKVMRV
ncbi:uncharacterized protein LOC111618738 [Centruroides sculpturatus]|uniref:uncharacterized protein LOC111618738 n=1 Tax=Centruroides sculpturatus TaxID=218467 RepID=UPI000C6D0D31|nr:uncharacterized protein LOC111618738 [Centruroides sculpturatus]